MMSYIQGVEFPFVILGVITFLRMVIAAFIDK
jgi:hypothetical protein